MNKKKKKTKNKKQKNPVFFNIDIKKKSKNVTIYICSIIGFLWSLYLNAVYKH